MSRERSPKYESGFFDLRVGVAAIVALVLYIVVVATSSGNAAQAVRCEKWSVRARIDGGAICLRAQQHCNKNLERQYRRYGFTCAARTLRVRWDYLRQRPLNTPQISPGITCPVTTQTGQVGSIVGLGRGPAYPIGGYSSIEIEFPPPEEFGTEWSGTKRVWLVDARYAGRILVRGRQLDGTNEVRFVNGQPGFTPEKLLNPVREFHLEGSGGYPSLTRLREPGCYAYQVDGRTFSYQIVFEARTKPAP